MLMVYSLDTVNLPAGYVLDTVRFAEFGCAAAQ